MPILKITYALFKEYPDMIPIMEVAIDMVLTVFFAGNIFFVNMWEGNPALVWFSSFGNNYIYVAGCMALLIVNILIFYLLWVLSKKYQLRDLYFVIAVSAFIGHVAGALTWLDRAFDIPAWTWMVYSVIFMEILAVAFVILIAKCVISEYETRYEGWL